MARKEKIRMFLICWLLIVPVIFIGMSDGNAQAATKYITILGGQVGGSWNPWASAMAVVFTKTIPGYSFSSGAGTGSPENIRRLNRGEIETGFGFASDLYESWRGGGTFKKELRNTRALTNLFANVCQILVHANSDIKTVQDLVGKKVAMGGPNSGAALTGELYFKCIGIYDKITPVFLGGSKAIDALGDRQVQAFNWHVNVGHSTIVRAASTFGIRLLETDSGAKQCGFYKKYSYFSPTVIPAGAYKGIDKPVPTFKQSTVWTAHKDTDPQLVYDMLTQMYSPKNKDFFTQSIGKVFLQMTKEAALGGITIPLHPGAERFWKEQGVAIPPEIASK